MLHFSIQKARAEDEKNLSCAAGCGLKGSCSDHDRIGRALHMTFQSFSENFLDILACHFCGTRNVWWYWKVTPVALLNENNVSYVAIIKHECRSYVVQTRQAQYLLEKFEWHVSCQAQMYLLFPTNLPKHVRICTPDGAPRLWQDVRGQGPERAKKMTEPSPGDVVFDSAHQINETWWIGPSSVWSRYFSVSVGFKPQLQCTCSGDNLDAEYRKKNRSVQTCHTQFL